MLIKEFQVILPMSVDEYRVAQLWSVAEASKNETGGGEGIEVTENRPFNEEEKAEYNSDGQYTHKIYHLASRVPKFIKLLAPKGSLEFHEKAWNAYPYCRTVVTNPQYMKDNFEIKIETWHKNDLGTSVNPHKLSEKDFSKTEVIRIDIANDPLDSSDYKPEFDPKLFKSSKAQRGPLGPKWIEEYGNQQNGEGNTKPTYMCAYKLVSCNFKWWGLQNRVESMIQKQERRLFTTFHRQVFCWMDNWYGLTMEDIRDLEDKTKHELDQMRQTGEIKGMVVKEN